MAILIGGTNGMLKAGTCVGVLYIETDPKIKKDPKFCKKYNGQWYCVHNGRLASDFKQTDTEIFIRHGKTYDKKTKRIVEEFRRLRNVQVVGRIIGTSPCQIPSQQQPIAQTNTLRPNWCGAFAYKEGPTIRVSNGKYLSYTPSPKEGRKCLLQSASLKPQFIVDYLHYNIYTDSSGKPFILEELVTRRNVVAVIGLSSLA